MRRPNRNIELFSLSVLDLFSAAMGAFIMIAVVLFPYYMRNKDLADEMRRLGQQNRELTDRVAGLTRHNDDLRSQLGTCETVAADAATRADASARRADASARAAATASDDAKKCLAMAGKSFLVAVVEWHVDGFDVDLHVRDPEGHEYWWKNKGESPGAVLSHDNTFGPGIEVWQHPTPAPGRYCIAYVLYEIFNKHKNEANPSVTVSGKVFYRGGNVVLPAVTLSRAQRFVETASLTLGGDGNVVVGPGASCSTQWQRGFQQQISRNRPAA